MTPFKFLRFGTPVEAEVQVYERWLERELDRAEAEADRGELVSSEEVMAEARALIRRLDWNGATPAP
jgi:predicted transcriptional regulator